MTLHDHCLVLHPRPPFCTNKSAIVNLEPPCPCNCFFCDFGTSSSHVSLLSLLFRADRSTINAALLAIMLPKSLDVSAEASVWISCAPSNLSQGRVGRGFSMIISGHPAFLISLLGFTRTSSSLRHGSSLSVFTLLKVRAVDLHLPDWLGRKPISSSSRESCPQLQAWQPSKGQILLNSF